MVFTWLLGRLLPQPSGGYASPLYPPQKSRWRMCSEHLKAGRASLWILVVEMAGWWVVHVVSNILFVVIVSGIHIDQLFSSTLVPGTCNSYMYPYWSTVYKICSHFSLSFSLSLEFKMVYQMMYLYNCFLFNVVVWKNAYQHWWRKIYTGAVERFEGFW